MSDSMKSGTKVCRWMCNMTDELRDMWLKQHSRSQIREFMNLTVSQGRLLRAVWRMTHETNEGVTLRELASKLNLSSSAVSVMVENLVQRDYLERVTSADDRRKVSIRISEKGVVHRQQIEKFFSDSVEEFIDGCDPEKFRCFEEILEKFNNFLTK